jgi:hypothetical protein
MFLVFCCRRNGVAVWSFPLDNVGIPAVGLINREPATEYLKAGEDVDPILLLLFSFHILDASSFSGIANCDV